MFKSLRVLSLVALVAAFSINQASAITLSFTGVTDSSGFSVDGAAAPEASDFTLEVEVAATANSGQYSLLGAAFKIATGSYSTVASWSTLINVVSDGVSLSITSAPFFAIDGTTGEHFLLNVSAAIVGADVDDVSTWAGGPYTGDFIVRGPNGFADDTIFSGSSPFSGTATLTTASSSPVSSVPDSGVTFSLLGLSLLALTVARKRMS